MNNEVQKSTPRKLLFYSYSIWKKAFALKKRSVFKSAEKFVYSRSSVIPRFFPNNFVFIYSGRKWVKIHLNKWKVGFKFGEFVNTRISAIYKSKQLRKKKLKKLKKK